MERRAQMVINTCTGFGDQNPIAMIHDVGAGGLSNALPERTLVDLPISSVAFFCQFLIANLLHSCQGRWIWRQF